MADIFSNNLKRFRLSKNLTQEQAAAALRVTSQTISRWECGTTLPDVLILPEIARLYCVTIDDLYREYAVPYGNYAQRLACVYESTRTPEDFLLAEQEFRKLFKSNAFTADDLRMYGIINQFMMNACKEKAITAFDSVIEDESNPHNDIYWRTRYQKLYLFSQIGKSEESIQNQLVRLERNRSEVREWTCLIAAYQHAGQYEQAYQWFQKAIDQFPDNTILHLLGGDCCQKLKRYEEAFQHWNNALQADPTLYDTKYSMGFCFEELGEYEKAYELWCEIAASLEKEGRVIEAKFPRDLAEKCKEKRK